MKSCPVAAWKMDLLSTLLFPLQMEADGALVFLGHMFFVCSTGSSFVFVILHWFPPPFARKDEWSLCWILSVVFILFSLTVLLNVTFSELGLFECLSRKDSTKAARGMKDAQPRQLQCSPFTFLSSTSFHLCWFNFNDFAVSVPSLSFVNASSLTARRFKRIDCNCFGWRFAELL